MPEELGLFLRSIHPILPTTGFGPLSPSTMDAYTFIDDGNNNDRRQY